MRRRDLLAFMEEMEELSYKIEEQVKELQGIQYRLTKLQREVYIAETEDPDDE